MTIIHSAKEGPLRHSEARVLSLPPETHPATSLYGVTIAALTGLSWEPPPVFIWVASSYLKSSFVSENETAGATFGG